MGCHLHRHSWGRQGYAPILAIEKFRENSVKDVKAGDMFFFSWFYHDQTGDSDLERGLCLEAWARSSERNVWAHWGRVPYPIAPCNQAILQTKRPRCGNFRGSEPVGACRKGWRLEVLTATLNFPAVQAVSDIFFLFLGRWCWSMQRDWTLITSWIFRSSQPLQTLWTKMIKSSAWNILK
jgi:hypothetical protein